MLRFLVLAYLAFASAPSAAAVIEGAAVVTDGDSLRIGAARVRLYGVDAPERGQSCSYQGKPWVRRKSSSGPRHAADMKKRPA